MWDCVLDALIDSLKIVPILYLVYLLVEFLEHKKKIKFENFIIKSKRVGPLWGSLLGLVPQCGFSAVMADLYSKRMITIGTLFAIFIATSDEALPILLGNPENYLIIIQLLVSKFIIACVVGFLLDLIFWKKPVVSAPIEDHNHEESCHCCAENIFLNALKHTFKIFIFVLIATLIINLAVYFIGEENIASFMQSSTLFAPFICSLIGLIPNCVSSVLLVELFLSGSINFASCIAGLCAGAGVGMLVLFKRNKKLKDNIFILVLLYVVSVLVGLILNLF